MKLLYWGRLRGPGGEAACDAVHTFSARLRRGGAVRRNKNFLKFFIRKQYGFIENAPCTEAGHRTAS